MQRISNRLTRKHLGAVTGAAFAAVAFSGSVTGFAAQEMASAMPAPVAGAAQPAGAVSRTTTPSLTQLHTGDKIKIGFFEHLELTQPGASSADGSASPLRTFYQRLDLSGDYAIDVDGTVAIPLLGRFTASGTSLDKLRDEISIAFERETGRGGEVHVTIVERQPIFVIGVVRNPGAYSFAPGMIAIQAVALAGGFERTAEVASQHIEAMRERERLEQAANRLTRLNAQRTRLVEERDAMPEAASNSSGDELLDAERGLRTIEAAVRKGSTDLQRAALESARGEQAALKGSLSLVEKQIEARSERLRVLQQMQGRGVTNLEAVWSAQKDMADLELQREQMMTQAHLVEQKVAQAEVGGSMIDLEHRARVVRDLVAVEAEIAQLESTVEASREMVRMMDAAASAKGPGPRDSVEIEILRRQATGVTTVAASESTDLIPGDVVKVIVRRTDPIQTSLTVKQ